MGGKHCTAGIPSSPRRGGLGLRPIYSPALFLGLGLAPLLGPSSVSQAGLVGRWPLGAEAPPTCPGILLLLWAQGGRNVAAGTADTSTNLYELSPLYPPLHQTGTCWGSGIWGVLSSSSLNKGVRSPIRLGPPPVKSSCGPEWTFPPGGEGQAPSIYLEPLWAKSEPWPTQLGLWVWGHTGGEGPEYESPPSTSLGWGGVFLVSMTCHFPSLQRPGFIPAPPKS